MCCVRYWGGVVHVSVRVKVKVRAGVVGVGVGTRVRVAEMHILAESRDIVRTTMDKASGRTRRRRLVSSLPSVIIFLQ